jgi:hypothetical protein
VTGGAGGFDGLLHMNKRDATLICPYGTDFPFDFGLSP